MTTENANPRTATIDALFTREVLRCINMEDATLAGAVADQLEAIDALVERVVDAFTQGGRLIYVGAAWG